MAQAPSFFSVDATSREEFATVRCAICDAAWRAVVSKASWHIMPNSWTKLCLDVSKGRMLRAPSVQVRELAQLWALARVKLCPHLS